MEAGFLTEREATPSVVGFISRIYIGLRRQRKRRSPRRQGSRLRRRRHRSFARLHAGRAIAGRGRRLHLCARSTRFHVSCQKFVQGNRDHTWRGGWPIGNGTKLSSSQSQLGQATCLAVAYLLSISCGPSYVRRLYMSHRQKLVKFSFWHTY